MLTIQADLKRYIQTSVQNLAKEVEATMRSNAPVYNGELIASIRTTRVNDYHYKVGPHTDHDYWAENGNGGFGGYIEPGHVMRWVDAQGRHHAAMRVRTYSATRYADGTRRKGQYAKRTVDKYR